MGSLKGSVIQVTQDFSKGMSWLDLTGSLSYCVAESVLTLDGCLWNGRLGSNILLSDMYITI